MNYVSDTIARRLPFFYGYVMLPLSMLMQIGTSPGQTFAVSAFTPALLSSLQLSESRLALAYMLGTLFAAVPLSAVGPISDRFGLRLASLTVVGALAVSCYLASMITGFATLLGVFFLLRFLGQGSLTLLSGNTTAMWFRSRLGRVSAVISIGTAAAFAWVPGMISDSITEYGWRETYRMIAWMLVLGLLPLMTLLFRNRPEDMGQQLDGIASGDDSQGDRSSSVGDNHEHSMRLSEALRTGSYFVLGLTNAVWAMVGTGIVFYLFTLCADRGFHEDTASALFKTFGLSMLSLQLVGNVLIDFARVNRLLGIGTSMLSLGLLVAWMADTSTRMHCFAVLFGGGQGMLIAVSGVAWVRFYGRKHLGSIRGAVWCATVAGSGCGPLIMGSIKDITGSYDLAILIFLALMAPLSLASWFVQPPAKDPSTSQ